MQVANAFYQEMWKCEWCQICSPSTNGWRTEKSTVCHVISNKLKMIHTFLVRVIPARNLGSWVWYGNKPEVITMEITMITMSKDGWTSMTKSQEYGDCSSWLWYGCV